MIRVNQHEMPNDGINTVSELIETLLKDMRFAYLNKQKLLVLQNDKAVEPEDMSSTPVKDGDVFRIYNVIYGG